MRIENRINKEIELGFTKEEIFENLKNDFDKEEIDSAMGAVNWTAIERKANKGKIKISNFTKIMGVSFLIVVATKLALPNMAKAPHNRVMTLIYLFGILLFISFFVRKK